MDGLQRGRNGAQPHDLEIFCGVVVWFAFFWLGGFLGVFGCFVLLLFGVCVFGGGSLWRWVWSFVTRP
ncbi:hypothetical protein, partial [Acinetobacter baumannii]